MGEKHTTKKKKSKIKSFFKILFFIIIILAGLFVWQVYQNGGGLKGFLLAILGTNKKDLEELDTVYILTLGVSTDLDNDLSDTIMLCGYNPKNNQAIMLSIPRDTFIGTNKDYAKATDKINSLYTKGPEKTVEAVEKLTGIDIDYYAVINNDLLIKIVDVIGGVTFNVPIDMDYDDPTQDLHIHLKKGLQLIDGEKAEQLLRFRHNNDGSSYPFEYGDNDFGRMRTQREFTKATLQQTLKAENIWNIKNMINTVSENLESNMPVDKILPYLPYTLDLDINGMRTEQLPGKSDLCNKVWIYVHDEEETKKLVDEMVTQLEATIEPDALDENTIKVENITK